MLNQIGKTDSFDRMISALKYSIDQDLKEWRFWFFFCEVYDEKLTDLPKSPNHSMVYRRLKTSGTKLSSTRHIICNKCSVLFYSSFLQSVQHIIFPFFVLEVICKVVLGLFRVKKGVRLLPASVQAWRSQHVEEVVQSIQEYSSVRSLPGSRHLCCRYARVVHCLARAWFLEFSSGHHW